MLRFVFRMAILPPKICLILGAVGACLTLVGNTLNLPMIGKAGTIAAVAAVVGIMAHVVVLLLQTPDSRKQSDTRLLTYLSTFFTDWLTGMSGPLSVPFAALAVWSSQRGQKILWGCLAVVAAIFGSYRVWRKERVTAYNHASQLQARIAELQRTIAAHEERRSQLQITVGNGSFYILTPQAGVSHGDFNGGHLQFLFMIENTGRRNSTINSYLVEIVELKRTFANLQPLEGRHTLPGRHCQLGLGPDASITRTGIIRVDAERATEYGTLLFFIPDLTLNEFVAAGLRMHGPERRFDPLHCRLTLTDTTGSYVTEEFELHEG